MLASPSRARTGSAFRFGAKESGSWRWGIYEYLGLGCLWPDRSPDVSLNVVPVDTIICCSAGYGLRKEPPSQFRFARMLRVFSAVFDRAQNAAVHRLHEAQRTDQITRFVFPYLGQQDRQLPNPPPTSYAARRHRLTRPMRLAFIDVGHGQCMVVTATNGRRIKDG